MQEVFDFKKLLRADQIAAFFWIIAAMYVFDAVDAVWYVHSFANSARQALTAIGNILLARVLCEILIVLIRIRTEQTKT